MKIKRFELDPFLPLDVAVRELARKEVEHAQAALLDRPEGTQKAIHEFRKSMKRLRALVRLVRTELGTEYKVLNRSFRDAARLLSRSRDEVVVQQTLRGLEEQAKTQPETKAVKQLRSLLKKRARTTPDDAMEEMIAAAVKRSRGCLRRLESVRLVSPRCIADGIEKAYRQARKRSKKAGKRDDEALHDFRKSLKYHRYHLRLLRPAYRAVLNAERRVAKEASDLLGDDHDLVVVRSLIEDCELPKGRRSTLERLISKRRAELQNRASYLTHRLLQEKPKHRRRRLLGYLDAAHADSEEG